MIALFSFYLMLQSSWSYDQVLSESKSYLIIEKEKPNVPMPWMGNHFYTGSNGESHFFSQSPPRLDSEARVLPFIRTSNQEVEPSSPSYDDYDRPSPGFGTRDKGMRGGGHRGSRSLQSPQPNSASSDLDPDLMNVYLVFPKKVYALGTPIRNPRLGHSKLIVLLPDSLSFLIRQEQGSTVGQLFYRQTRSQNKNAANDDIKLDPTDFDLQFAANSGFEKVGKVLVGGVQPDHACAHPVLLSDWNGTLSKGDSCQINFINQFLNERQGFLVVVSTMGSSVPVETLKGKDLNRVLVFENVGGEVGGDEKATRISLQFFNSGICLAGFAGDTPQVDGTTAVQLGIPYFAVNQTDLNQSKVEIESYHVCAYKKDSELDLENGSNQCPKNYSLKNYTEIECTRTSSFGVVPNWIRKDDTTLELPRDSVRFRNERHNLDDIYGADSSPDQTGIQEDLVVAGGLMQSTNPCGVGARATGKERTISRCTLQVRAELQPTGQGQCPEGYDFLPKHKIKRTSLGAVPAFDINNYPVGSVYARNWCELAREVGPQFNLKLRAPSLQMK